MAGHRDALKAWLPAAAIALAAGHLAAVPPTFRDALDSGGKGPLMVVIDGGQMRMGHIKGIRIHRPQRSSSDPRNLPAHDVRIEHAYAFSVDHITVEEFGRFVDATGYRTDAERDQFGLRDPGPAARPTWYSVPYTCWGMYPRDALRHVVSPDLSEVVLGLTWRDPGYDQAPNEPVTCVSAADADAYAAWLADETGEPYRLPSEAEWEYAARGMRGDEELKLDQHEWVDEIEAFSRSLRRKISSGTWTKSTVWGGYGGSGTTTRYSVPAPPTSTMPANIFGVRGLTYRRIEDEVAHESVFSYTADCVNLDYMDAPVDGTPWLSGDCDERIVRGGGHEEPVTNRGSTRGMHAAAVGSSIRVVRAPMYQPRKDL